MGDFIIVMVVTLVTVTVPVIKFSKGIDTTFFERSFKIQLLYIIILSAG